MLGKVLLFFAIVSIVLCSEGESRNRRGNNAINWERVWSGGRWRNFGVVLPPVATAGVPMKVVIAIHGLGGNPLHFRDVTKIDGYAKGGDEAGPFGDDASEFMTVYPEGLRDTDGDLVNVSHRDRSWNGGECCGFAQYVDFPDTEFIAIHLLAKLSQNYNIDPSEVYVTGFSNGCLMTHRLLCTYPEVFAAASCAGGLLNFADCGSTYSQTNSPHPLRLKTIHGSDDPQAPAQGAQLSFQFWRSVEQCPWGGVQTSTIGSLTTCSTYQNCATNAELVHCEREGGDHIWYRDQELDYSYQVLNFFGLV